jgi:mannose-1-phosphate guanylyltransferase
MKTYCIEFERELEGKDVIHVKLEEKPTIEEAEDIVENEGYMFNKGYDEIINVYEI